jgi:hypothetical protein
MEIPLYNSADITQEDNDSDAVSGDRLNIDIHEGTLYIRPTVSPMYGARKIIDPSQLTQHLSLQLVAVGGAENNVLVEQSDGALTSQALMTCMRGSPLYPNCLRGDHKLMWAQNKDANNQGDIAKCDAEGRCPAGIGIGAPDTSSLAVRIGVDAPQTRARPQLYDNIYYIIMGVMIWPAIFAVLWFLANRGYARRLRMIIGWLIGWAHNKVNKWDDTQKQSDNNTSSQSQQLSLIDVSTARTDVAPMHRGSKLFASPLAYSPTAAQYQTDKSCVSETWSSDGDLDTSSRSKILNREWSGGRPPRTDQELLKELDADALSTRKVCHTCIYTQACTIILGYLSCMCVYHSAKWLKSAQLQLVVSSLYHHFVMRLCFCCNVFPEI